MNRFLTFGLGVLLGSSGRAAQVDAPTAPSPESDTNGSEEVWDSLEESDVTWQGRTFAARKGFLSVPANRARGDELQIEFLWVRSPAATRGIPTVYLQGGPGMPTIDMAPVMTPLLVPLLEVDDLILVDQRGSGRSLPDLKCGHAVRMPLDEPVDRAGVSRALADLLRGCRAHFAADGIELADYNTRENADDVAALAAALGLDHIRLFGSSYGSHLALALIARHPDLVDSAILEAVSLPDSIIKLPADYEFVLASLEARLAGTELARRLDGGLRRALKRCLERADLEPYVVPVIDPDDGRSVSLPIGSFDLVNVVIDGLRTREFTLRLPALVARLDAGDATDWAPLVLEHRRWSAWPVSHFAMRAASGLASERHELILEQAPASTLGHALESTCWSAREALGVEDLGPGFRALPRVNIPVLAFSGSLDPQTPPSAVERLRPGMPRLVHVVIEDAFHADPFVLLSPRVVELLQAFLRRVPLKDETLAGPPLEFAAY